MRRSSLFVCFVVAVLFLASCASQYAAKHRERGAVQFSQNQYDLARTEYAASLEYEDHPEAHAWIGRILTEKKQWLEALPHLQKALAGETAPELRWQAVLDTARCRLNLGANADAADFFVRAIEFDPADHTAPVLSAAVWPKLDSDARLMGWLDRIVAAQPDKHYGQAFIGNHYFRIGEMEKAREAYEKALAIFPRSVPVLVRLGGTLLQLGDPKGAEARFKEAMAIQDDIEIHFGLAGALFMQGRLVDARAELEQVLAAKPDHGGAHALMAQLLSLGEEKAEAIRHGLAAQKKMADHIGLTVLLGNLGMTTNRYDLAADQYARLVDLEPAVSDHYEKLGLAQVYLERNEAAQKSFIQSITLDPVRPVSHRELGILHYKNGLLEAAIAELGLSAQFAPDNGRTQLHLGYAYFDQGPRYYDDAARAFTRAADLIPNHPEPRVRLAAILCSQGRLRAGVDRLAEAAELGFDDPAFLQHRAFDGVRYGPRFKEIEKMIAANVVPMSVPLVPLVIPTPAEAPAKEPVSTPEAAVPPAATPAAAAATPVAQPPSLETVPVKPVVAPQPTSAQSAQPAPEAVVTP